MNEFEKTMEETFDIQVEQSAPIQEFKQAKITQSLMTETKTTSMFVVHCMI